jgi:hypothetical protein
VTTATPSFAAAGGTNVCESFDATAVAFTNPVIGTLSGCHQQGSGTTVEVVDLNHPFAPTPVTIHWATGHATSEVIVSVSALSGENPCPNKLDSVAHVSITVVHGPYSGSTGGYVQCLDVSNFPILHATSVGPVVI